MITCLDAKTREKWQNKSFKMGDNMYFKNCPKLKFPIYLKICEQIIYSMKLIDCGFDRQGLVWYVFHDHPWRDVRCVADILTIFPADSIGVCCDEGLTFETSVTSE